MIGGGGAREGNRTLILRQLLSVSSQTKNVFPLQETAGTPVRQEFLHPETPDLKQLCLCQGGVVGITIDWNCDLDWHVRHCKPIYEFHGLYEEKNLSPGFNFRCLLSPYQCTLPWGPEGFSTPRIHWGCVTVLGGEQRSPDSSHSAGAGQAGRQQGTRPWRAEPLPLEDHLARTGNFHWEIADIKS